MKNTFLILFVVSLFSFNAYAEESTIPTSGNDCGEHCSWKIEGGVLTLTGYGDMYNFSRSCDGGCHNMAPWAASANKITKIVVENESGTTGFNSIGNQAFTDMRVVREAVLPEGLKKIGYGAFLANSQLTTVNLPSSLTSIGGFAFDDTRLTSIEIPPLVTILDDSAFGNIRATEVIIPENVTTISPHAFTISDGTSNMPLEKLYCPEHLQDQCAEAIKFRTDNGLKTEIIPYQKTSDGKVFYNNKWYKSANDILSDSHIQKRIYTVDEADKISGKSNTFKIRYK